MCAGEAGYSGEDGEKGERGERGHEGKQGVPGEEGPHGRNGKDRMPQTEILTLHRQASKNESCPPNTRTLWSGHTLVDTENWREHSCLRQFAPKGRMEVSGGSVRYSSTQWLAKERGDGVEVDLEEAEELLAWCSVCEVEGGTVTVHSQTTSLPECPEDWASLWTGYSSVSGEGGEGGGRGGGGVRVCVCWGEVGVNLCAILMLLLPHTHTQMSSGVQQMNSPSACVETLSETGMLRCDGRATCSWGSYSSHWLTALDADTGEGGVCECVCVCVCVCVCGWVGVRGVCVCVRVECGVMTVCVYDGGVCVCVRVECVCVCV